MGFIAAMLLDKLSDEARSSPIYVSNRPYGCPLFLMQPDSQDFAHGFDCRISKINDDAISDESWGLFNVVFLDPEKASLAFKIGTQFYLWEGGRIGQGIIVTQ